MHQQPTPIKLISADRNTKKILLYPLLLNKAKRKEQQKNRFLILKKLEQSVDQYDNHTSGGNLKRCRSS